VEVGENGAGGLKMRGAKGTFQRVPPHCPHASPEPHPCSHLLDHGAMWWLGEECGPTHSQGMSSLFLSAKRPHPIPPSLTERREGVKSIWRRVEEQCSPLFRNLTPQRRQLHSVAPPRGAFKRMLRTAAGTGGQRGSLGSPFS